MTIGGYVSEWPTCWTDLPCYHDFMAKQQSDKPDKAQRRHGPPDGGAGTLIGVRISADDLVLLDRWRAEQSDRPGRPEAIRRLVEQFLGDKAR